MYILCQRARVCVRACVRACVCIWQADTHLEQQSICHSRHRWRLQLQLSSCLAVAAGSGARLRCRSRELAGVCAVEAENLPSSASLASTPQRRAHRAQPPASMVHNGGSRAARPRTDSTSPRAFLLPHTQVEYYMEKTFPGL